MKVSDGDLAEEGLDLAAEHGDRALNRARGQQHGFGGAARRGGRAGDVAQHPDNYIGALRRAGGQGRDEAGDADNNDRSLVVLGGEEIQTLKHDDPAAENRRRVAPLHCFRVN